MIANILLDLDGTLTDPKEGITRCIQFALEQFNITIPSQGELTWCIGPPLKASFSQILKTSHNDILDEALAFYRQRFSKTGMFENTVYPDVEPTLKKIKASGFRIFLATAKPRVFAQQILEHFNLSNFFTGIYGSELDGALSDKGDLIAHILKKENLDPLHSLMVGDRIHDIEGGKKNGVSTAAVLYGYGSSEEIELAKPDIVFNAFSDLLPYLLTANSNNV